MLAEMTPIGGTLAEFLSYEEEGGSCAREDCDQPAPIVVLGGHRIELPCSAHAEEERHAREARALAAKVATLIEESGATPRFREWSLATYREACGDDAGLQALAVVERWLALVASAIVVDDEDEFEFDPAVRLVGSVPNLVLYGPVGSGKTGLAWGAIRSLMERGVETRWVNFRALLEAMKDCFDRHEPVRNALSVGRVPVLVLDDLGSEVPTKWAREQLLGIVDYRYERRLPTIFVSNYAPSALAARLGHDNLVIGERIVSRMTDGSVQHAFRSSDRRAVKAAA